MEHINSPLLLATLSSPQLESEQGPTHHLDGASCAAGCTALKKEMLGQTGTFVVTSAKAGAPGGAQDRGAVSNVEGLRWHLKGKETPTLSTAIDASSSEGKIQTSSLTKRTTEAWKRTATVARRRTREIPGTRGSMKWCIALRARIVSSCGTPVQLFRAPSAAEPCATETAARESAPCGP